MTFIDPLADHRSRLALEQSDAIERRSRKLAEQTAAMNSPDARLRIWEELHAVNLPREERHPLINVIARDTGLTPDQVRDEQRQRAAAAAERKSTDEEVREIWDPYCTHPSKASRPKP